MSQLPLALGGLGPPDFAHYWPECGLVSTRLQAYARAPAAVQIHLTGPDGSGKTHLLLACCALAESLEHSVQYLPLQRVPLDALQLAGGVDLLVIDDGDRALLEREWALALFAAINRQHDARRALLLASRAGPSAALLPDLGSRLALAERLRLDPHTDEARAAILHHRASRAGIPLDDAAVDYLLRHGARELKSLMAQLAALDREALARGRRVTVPLIRQVLGQG